MSGRSLVHINGRTYDTSQPVQPGQSIDGFVVQRSKTRSTREPVSVKPQQRQPQKTHTLHRTAVKKPARLSDISPPAHKAPLTATPHARQHTAVHTVKSPLIRKFSDVNQAPSQYSPQPKSSEHLAMPVPELSPAAPPISKSDMFIERQLRLAEAHQKQLHKKKKLRERLVSLQVTEKRSFRVGTAVIVGLLIFGFVLYQNTAGISMQIASRRAGFAAALPSFTPGGYKLDGPVAYSPGKVIVSFSSTTNDKNYQIEQQPSQWTADVLQEQVASANSGQYQAYQSKGIKIFFTSSNTATWVEEGVLYTLRGDSGLASEQIASIAASM